MQLEKYSFDVGDRFGHEGKSQLQGFLAAKAGGEGLSIAKRIYADSFARFDELCAPYTNVVDIDKRQLPAPAAVSDWNRDDFVNAVRHNLSCSRYNAADTMRMSGSSCIWLAKLRLKWGLNLRMLLSGIINISVPR